VSSPEQPHPKFFLDRSLGRKAVPEVLRADGWEIVTLAEHYGVPADEQVADVDWIKNAAGQGWPILPTARSSPAPRSEPGRPRKKPVKTNPQHAAERPWRLDPLHPATDIPALN
jgi:hypothetical protein